MGCQISLIHEACTHIKMVVLQIETYCLAVEFLLPEAHARSTTQIRNQWCQYLQFSTPSEIHTFNRLRRTPLVQWALTCTHWAVLMGAQCMRMHSHSFDFWFLGWFQKWFHVILCDFYGKNMRFQPCRTPQAWFHIDLSLTELGCSHSPSMPWHSTSNTCGRISLGLLWLG